MNPCDLFGGNVCAGFQATVRPFTDDELAIRVLAKEMLSERTAVTDWNPKVAFMFLIASDLPFERVWEKFFQGNEGFYSIYVHASNRDSSKVWNSTVFAGREIPSKEVHWGQIEMIDAERRLLTFALQDLDNQYFALLSESCIPLYNFEYTYHYLIRSRMSFVDSFKDPGPHGQGRYSERMAPEVSYTAWTKGAQWFAVHRKHAVLIIVDYLYYNKFKDFCKPGQENKNCYPDEHYIQTFLHIMDPSHLSNWTVTYVDWSEHLWHPKSFEEGDIAEDLFRTVKAIQNHEHVTSETYPVQTSKPCLWNGRSQGCFLFARKFRPETAEALVNLLPSKVWNNSIHHSRSSATPDDNNR